MALMITSKNILKTLLKNSMINKKYNSYQSDVTIEGDQ